MAKQKREVDVREEMFDRVKALHWCFILIGMCVLARLVWVSFFSAEVAHNAARLEERIFIADSVYARRGSILARDGEPLATSILRYRVDFDMASEGFDSLEIFRKQADTLSKRLAGFFGGSAASYRDLMLKRHQEHYRLVYRKDSNVLRSEGWFDRINRYAEEAGVIVEHYVLSSGLKEIIEGTSIAKYFKKIYACEFLYKDGQAYWPKMAVNYTNKTQFVYRINKGVLDINNNVDLNSSRPDNEKRVLFSNMIYIGDGLTDVPCMKLVKQSGGRSIAIYHPGEDHNAAPLLKHKRVDWMFEADYSKGSELDRTMELLLKNLAYQNKLQEINEQQKKDLDEDL